MKILYVHSYDPRCRMGGAEQVVLDLARSMKQHFQYEVAAAVSGGDLLDRLRTLEIPVTKIFRSRFQTPGTLAGLGRVLRNFQPDLVHSHHRYLTFLLDLFFKKEARLLHTQHLVTHDKKWFFRSGLRATAVSESVRQNLIKEYRVPADRVQTITNAVSLRARDPQTLRGIQEHFPRPSGGILGLFLGRLEEQKGFRYLIDAVASMPVSCRAKLKILAAGEGTLSKSLQRAVQEKGLGREIIFLGYRSDVPELLEASDFLVLPSLWEGMPLTLLEAYSVGRPVLATDIPGTRDIVLPGRTGELVRARDAAALARVLERWIEWPEEMLARGRGAREYWQKNFSFEQMIQNYHDLYQKLGVS